jgi:hypothetical protein
VFHSHGWKRVLGVTWVSAGAAVSSCGPRFCKHGAWILKGTVQSLLQEAPNIFKENFLFLNFQKREDSNYSLCVRQLSIAVTK